ncbi:transmembrane protein, putative (macronuclear) [Tetrahymena thermophila SB210]|uniref:Transmembrane protein, putative n=1 Tax=Tetrahymena thermophila (strain SB210) TaxID=312017 RepID=W7X1F1_TETTS|nr:transmembrane protein, putative [Tetrahymena thermophila SB210]EWS71427.1 transmembrane protein, putative [Tetrahymena thermophila SB210]|eukprot:XP_012656033.1 transmembrane protein, putative [Tetrahymena thermophila SB210]
MIMFFLIGHLSVIIICQSRQNIFRNQTPFQYSKYRNYLIKQSRKQRIIYRKRRKSQFNKQSILEKGKKRSFSFIKIFLKQISQNRLQTLIQEIQRVRSQNQNLLFQNILNIKIKTQNFYKNSYKNQLQKKYINLMILINVKKQYNLKYIISVKKSDKHYSLINSQAIHMIQISYLVNFLFAIHINLVRQNMKKIKNKKRYQLKKAIQVLEVKSTLIIVQINKKNMQLDLNLTMKQEIIL